MIKYPFQISEQDVERSDTMERSDIGRWAILLHGCFIFVAGPDPIDVDDPKQFKL